MQHQVFQVYHEEMGPHHNSACECGAPEQASDHMIGNSSTAHQVEK